MTLQATHKVGGSFLPPMSATIGYNLRRIRFYLVVLAPRLCHLCHFAALPTRKYIQQPRERRAPYQLNNPYHLDFLDPLLLIVNIWNSRIANVFHLRRKLHFKQQGAMFLRAMARNYWKGKNQ